MDPGQLPPVNENEEFPTDEDSPAFTIFENKIWGVYITPNGDLKIETDYHYGSEYLFISSATRYSFLTKSAKLKQEEIQHYGVKGYSFLTKSAKLKPYR